MTDGLVILHSESSMNWGGQEIRVLNEAAGLRERGHEVAILCQPQSTLAARAREAALPILLNRMPFTLNPRTVIGMIRHFLRWRPRVVVTHSSVDSWCAGAAARILSLPVVRVRHVSVPIGRNPICRIVYRLLCDAVITTGEAIRQHLIRDVGLPPAKVLSIPTGVDTAHFDPRKADGRRVRAALGIQPDVPLVGMVAVLRSWKGHQVFLEAMVQVRRHKPAARALIVGEGPQRHNIERRRRELGLEDTLILTGHRQDVPDILAGLDVVVSASTGAEGVPQVLLQALAMERPVVATAVGAISEVIRHGETGCLVPPGDPGQLAEAIVAVLNDPAAVRGQTLAARQWVCERWGYGRMLDAVEQLYARVARPPW
jgi:glycosyltransferase involved in cell wall biosynthesis